MKRRAIVTGANSGIGREVTRQLAEDGWQVLAVDLEVDDLPDLDKESDGRIMSCEADVSIDGAAETIVAEALEKLGGLDLLVNNAGTSWVGQFSDMPTADIDRLLNVNVRGLMLLCRAAVPALEESQQGQIINIGSLVAHLPQETLALYCASKAAVVAFSQSLAKELAPRGIRVNVLSPCGTDTAIFEKAGSEVDRKLLVPPADMANLAVFLTKLPNGLDIGEIIPHQRLAPL